ncbi:MAG: hypothetical protein KJS95_10795 [Gammaproteobacteria bacterium]|nr:hypothetical protein [Gammaproteobacteria bacterium]
MSGSAARRRSGGRLAALGLACLLGLAACDRGPAPLPPEALQIRINLLCTTCDDFLRCTRTADAGSERYLLYRLREKSFWAQIATIWDYLVQWLRRKSADTRPLTIYENVNDARRVVLVEGRARVDAVSGLIALPDASIDMRNGDWRDRAGELQGRCSTLKRREGYAWVRGLLGRELPKAGAP